MDMRTGHEILLSGLVACAAGALLYVASTSGRYRSSIGILSFPAGTPVGKISLKSYVSGVCADSSGNVWLTTYADSAWTVYEYAHGGTKPISEIKPARRHAARGCAVDPTTGDLATLDDEGVEIFRGAKQGKAIDYSLGYVTPIACTFDSKGNLFIDGIQGSTTFFLIEELAKGSSKFEYLSLDSRYGFPAGIAWDGTYVAIATGGNGLKPVIYRFVVSGKTAKVVQSVHPDGLYYQPWIAINDGKVAGTARRGGHHVDIWTYPAGGEPIEKPSEKFKTTGLTISVAN